VGIAAYKPASQPMYYGANNHGSIIEIENQWYIFYHRHTNGTNFSRQGCIEKIFFDERGHIPQVEMTSCCGTPLKGEGYYPAYLACSLFTSQQEAYTDCSSGWMDSRFPKITQDGGDGDKEVGYVCCMRNGAACGFKYFDCKGVKAITIRTRGYARGPVAVRTAWDGDVLGIIDIPDNANFWTDHTAPIALPDGIQALYFTFQGQGALSLAGFTLHT